jgi:hypothetical protein
MKKRDYDLTVQRSIIRVWTIVEIIGNKAMILYTNILILQLIQATFSSNCSSKVL